MAPTPVRELQRDSLVTIHEVTAVVATPPSLRPVGNIGSRRPVGDIDIFRVHVREVTDAEWRNILRDMLIERERQLRAIRVIGRPQLRARPFRRLWDVDASRPAVPLNLERHSTTSASEEPDLVIVAVSVERIRGRSPRLLFRCRQVIDIPASDNLVGIQRRLNHQWSASNPAVPLVRRTVRRPRNRHLLDQIKMRAHRPELGGHHTLTVNLDVELVVTLPEAGAGHVVNLVRRTPRDVDRIRSDRHLSRAPVITRNTFVAQGAGNETVVIRPTKNGEPRIIAIRERIDRQLARPVSRKSQQLARTIEQRHIRSTVHHSELADRSRRPIVPTSELQLPSGPRKQIHDRPLEVAGAIRTVRRRIRSDRAS